MTYTNLLSLSETEMMGPPLPEDIRDTDIPEAFLLDLTLKHVSTLPDPTTAGIAERLQLPRTLTEELLQHLYREKLIEIKLQASMGSTRYGMLDRGWDKVSRCLSICGYVGPAPVSLEDYRHMMRLQAKPTTLTKLEKVKDAFKDLVLPDSLIQTIGCVINSRRSLFLTGMPGTGKTAVAERMNRGLEGSIWIPYAVEVDGQIIRIFDSHNHRPVEDSGLNHDRRWIRIQRPLVIVGGELTLQNADLVWSEAARFYEAPFQMKANGGTLVIDDFGRQQVAPQDLLNRWIIPLEKRIDYLTLQTGKKIEVPFEQLIVFSTNLEEKDLVDEAFLRRMGYRAKVEPPSSHAYVQIFRREAAKRSIEVDDNCLDYLLEKYAKEGRQMKGCEPRDLLDRITDICLFEDNLPRLDNSLLDVAWQNYFGASHKFSN
jgi:hypothetical protein